MDVVKSNAGTGSGRKFLPPGLSFDHWENIEPLFAELDERSIGSTEEFYRWLLDVNELETVLDEEYAWRYIRTTCDTTNESFEKSFDHFVSEIEPRVAPWDDKLNRKIDSSPFRDSLDPSLYSIFLRSVRNEISLFREKNIPLFTRIDQLSQKYGKIAGEMMVVIDEKELTIQQASNYFKHTDRKKREEAFRSIWKRRLEDKNHLDELFDQLCHLRNEVAENAGFENFRDYSFAELGRFDYTVKDCFDLHDAVEKEVIPFIGELEKKRKKELALDDLRPWDLEVDTSGLAALQPFSNGKELLEKTIACFYRIKPQYAEFISIMRGMDHFDLDSRKGKAPGGYNYSLAETGVPFIFMNSAGSQRDVVTMVHEGGHAIHSFLENHLPINALKNPPSEVCELASMSMELISMEHWNVFYADENDLRRAKREQLEKILATLPWVVSVDSFQHWIYENNGHSADERRAAWEKTRDRFESDVVNWNGLEEIKNNSWQKQLHIFEVPFYYIEYGMAQLGAIALWRNYKKDPQAALGGYEAALKLGYTKPIGRIYEAAGIEFNFSRAYVRELVTFVKEELNQL
ncbi:MAG: M3 family oligoendopeptidase [Bacteroidetes bacterium]|nr:M3 family oligoendopeptidase [Bacteroidota bacterium]